MNEQYKNIPPKEIQNAIWGACFEYADWDKDISGTDVQERVYECWQRLHYILKQSPDYYASWIRNNEPDIEV